MREPLSFLHKILSKLVFTFFVQHANLSGKYSDMGEYYRSWYEQETFEADVRNLFDELAPLYDQLHTYVRRKLKDFYNTEEFPSTGHIPAHIFGNSS